MMEEHEYHLAYQQLNPHPCIFEKAILSTRCSCGHCQRLNLAEREGAACLSPTVANSCAELLTQLRHHAQFALKLSSLTKTLPHTKAMKIQGGGLLGLQAVLYPHLANAKQVENISALIEQIITRYGQFNQLPPSEMLEVIKFISHYQVRGH